DRIGREKGDGSFAVQVVARLQVAEGSQVAVFKIILGGADDGAKTAQQSRFLLVSRSPEFRQSRMAAYPLDGGAGNVRQAEQAIQADAGVLDQAVGEVDG